ncbi:hypothetical protein [Streptomyces shenzhenensis]|uniref:hypothetical protein n=1 Tax=Streptomyces shenzhenensis TaxID=943815 RepID=UPI0011C3F748|nr:hypothetical protein [Streptomyces shenzhenensis]
MRNRIIRALAASVAAGMLASGAAVASTGTALAAPATAPVADNPNAPTPHPTKTPKHKKCPKGEHYTKVHGKWGCHKR